MFIKVYIAFSNLIVLSLFLGVSSFGCSFGCSYCTGSYYTCSYYTCSCGTCSCGTCSCGGWSSILTAAFLGIFYVVKKKCELKVNH